jgi:flap endonuclease-1
MREAYVQVDPELVQLQETLTALRLSRQQMIDLGILIGTDFNPDGFKGIGPKTALKLLRESGDIEKIAAEDSTFKTLQNLHRIREIFLKPDVTSNYTLKWKEPQVDPLVRFLCGDRDFSEERVRTAVERMKTGKATIQEKQTLESFFSG